MSCVVAALLATTHAVGDYRLEAGVGALRHDGHLQTPAGGQPGTSSMERPTFAELELERGSAHWFAASVDIRRYRLRIRYTAIGDEADAVLATPLTSQGQAFLAGESVLSRLSLHRLTVALMRTFEFDGGVFAEVGGEIGWTGFDLRVEGERHDAGTSRSQVDRAYRVHAIGLRAATGKRLGERLRVAATLGLGPAFDGAGSSYFLEPRVSFLLGKRTALGLGARFELFRYDDAHKQTLPNRLDVGRRVLPAFSMSVRF